MESHSTVCKRRKRIQYIRSFVGLEMSDNENALKTALMTDCHYFREVIEAFKFPFQTVRLLRLGIGAEIKPHQDHELGYKEGVFRLHIPISTSDGVQFILDNTLLKMLPGQCWYTNVNYEHSVSNMGKTDRVHLVIDGIRNEWSDKMFFEMAPVESFQSIPFKESTSVDIIRQTIEGLELSDFPANKELKQDLAKATAESTTLSSGKPA